MVHQRMTSLGVCLLSLLLVFLSCSSLPEPPASRNISIQTRTPSGANESIRLYSEYYALVVGCGQYTRGWPALPNPVKDAMEVAALLKGLGWRVDVLMDPEGAKLRRELNRLVTGVGRKKDKAILLWFSGHGQTIEEADGTKLGYLVPVDAPDPDIDLLGFMEKAISMRQIETVSKQIRSKHVLMAFDSCFSGAIFQMVRTKPSPYIQQKVSNPVRQFITAGREDEQVPDKSVFKAVFIQGIKEGFADINRDSYITGEELGAYLQENVINYSRNAQHPQFGKINNPRLDKGDFVIVIEPSGVEKPKLAYIPQEIKTARVSLRKEPRTLGKKEISNILVKYRFFDYDQHSSGDFKNEFRVNADGTITDDATALQWQRSGSPEELSHLDSKRYINNLNKEKFAGYSDWRLPTIEELASLLANTDEGLFINPVFDTRQNKCWSADNIPMNNMGHAVYYKRVWIIDFINGKVNHAVWVYKAGGPAFLTWPLFERRKSNYVRAVRSLE